MKHTRPTPLALAALALVATTATQAQSIVESQASISNFKLRLVDLDPNDGIAPSIAWDTQNAYLGALLAGNAEGDRVPGPDEFAPPQEVDLALLLAGQPFQLSQPSGKATVNLQADTWSASTVIQPSASFNEESGGQSYASARFASTGRTPELIGELGFTLSPKTQLVLEGAASVGTRVDTQTLVSFMQTHPQGVRTEDDLRIETQPRVELSTDTQIELQAVLNQVEISTPGSSAYLANGSYINLAYRTWLGTSGSPDYTDTFDPAQATVIDKNMLQPFVMNINNFESTPRPGLLSLLLDSRASVDMYEDTTYLPIDPVDPTPSIPEPGTWALMGLGLVGLGWATRRNRAA